MDVSEALQQAIGAKIVARRKALKWTQPVLAEKLGVSIQWISRVERGHENITVGTLAKIAEALGTEVKKLLP
jgi:y4mF family transcriptional regulator